MTAAIGDWVIGSGSADKKIKRGGYLVYAMLVAESLSFQEYWEDPRFQRKKPSLWRSRMQACGDNIYRCLPNGRWEQMNSYHSNADGAPNSKHIKRDTGVNRVLVSNTFVYFGGEGPRIPKPLRNHGSLDICVNGRGRKVFDDPTLIEKFATWFASIDVRGYAGEPLEWVLSP